MSQTKTDPRRNRSQTGLWVGVVVAVLALLVGAAIALACRVHRIDSRIAGATERDCRPKMGTGDILLVSPLPDLVPVILSGEGVSRYSFKNKVVKALQQSAIKLATNSTFTHAAIVRVDPDCGCVSVWDMTGKGTRLDTIENFLSRMGRCRVTWRKLVSLGDRQSVLCKELDRVVDEHASAAYSHESLANAWVRRFLARRKKRVGLTTQVDESELNFRQGYYCSSVVALAQERMQICDWSRATLPGYWPLPKDFLGSKLDAACLPGWRYLEPVLVHDRSTFPGNSFDAAPFFKRAHRSTLAFNTKTSTTRRIIPTTTPPATSASLDDTSLLPTCPFAGTAPA
jgi:hypothetical protein